MTREQQPHEPHEIAVIGAMLMWPDSIPDLVDVVSEGDFGLSKCRAAFRAIVRVVDRAEPIDIVTVEAELQRAHELALVGGLEGLGAFCDRSIIGPGVQHHLHHARQVRAYAAVRELGQAAGEIVHQCRKLELDPRSILDKSQELLAPRLAVDAEVEPMNAVIHRTFRGIVRRREGFTGARTGLAELDDLILGMDPGNLYVIGARPGMGKTALATSILRWNAKRENPAAIITLEMPASQLTERLLCADAGVDNQVVRAGTATAPELARLVRAAERLNATPFQVIDLVGQRPDMRAIRARARAWRRKYPNAERPLLALDYLGLVHGDGDTAEERVAEVCRSTKELAGELRCPVLLLAQLNRGVESRGSSARPRMSDLRGSGAIEQDADGILFVYRGVLAGDDSMAKDEGEIILEKHRHGPTGHVRVRYIGPRTLFCNLRRQPDDDEA